MRIIEVENRSGSGWCTVDSDEHAARLEAESREDARQALRSIGRVPDERRTTRELFAEYKANVVTEPVPPEEGGRT